MKQTKSAVRKGVILYAASALLLAGCWDRREINDVAFVLASSFDSGSKGTYDVGVLIALPGQMGGATGGGGGTSGQKPYYIDSSRGANIRDAVERLQKRMARQLNTTHRRVMIVSEELARKGIRPLFDLTVRVPQNRLTAFMVISQGKARDLLSAAPHMERFSGEAIREILTLNPVGRANLKEISQKLGSEGIDPIVPVFAPVPNRGPNSKKEVQAVGLALFADDKMMDIAKGEEANALLWMANHFQPYDDLVPVRGKAVSISVEAGRAELHLKEAGKRLRFLVKVDAEGGVLEDAAPGDLFDEDNLHRVEAAWKAALTRRMQQIIKKLQRLHSDALGAGLKLYRTYPDEWAKRKDRWHEEFASSEFEVQVTVHIRRVGQASGNVSNKRGGEE